MKRGVLISMIWALSYRLNAQVPSVPARKIAGKALRVYDSYSPKDKLAIEALKAQLWAKIEEEYPGEVNIPVVITELYWAFPEVFGKKMQKWVDLLDDQIISKFENDDLIAKSRSLVEKVVELLC